MERQPNETVDKLRFGVISLDVDDEVVFFSKSERSLSGNREEVTTAVLRRDCPCMNNGPFNDRIDYALSKRTLNTTFDHIV